MKERLRGYIDKLFEDAPKSAEAMEVKEELLTNLLEHYNDLIANGKIAEEAYEAVVSNIGDISEVIASLKAANRYEQKQTESDNGFYDKTWTIGSMIDNFINNVASAFDKDYPEVSDKSYSMLGVNNINVDFVSETIKLFVHDSEEIRVVEYMSKVPTKEELAQVSTINEDLTIRNGKRLFFIAKSRVEIYLPKSYHGNLKINVTSSTIKSTDRLELKDVKISGISCPIAMEMLIADNVFIHSTSGGIKINKLTGKHELSTESGSIKLGQVSGSGKYKTTSGSINVVYTELGGVSDFSVISGSTRVSVPNNTSFTYDVQVVSGNIHTCLDAAQYSSSRNAVKGIVGEETENKIYIKSISGGVWIQND